MRPEIGRLFPRLEPLVGSELLLLVAWQRSLLFLSLQAERRQLPQTWPLR